ncbi:dolichyl-diphosphooligosaccharide--protein glycosyltransferase subunit 2 isoform X1 [Musca domestica]|uniref:Dolichyl-diphosphooligosaccharide--protein glycosyltransferase subunit 2 n=1 Tax=Musca domestica TaxID=7370 RepID=A0A1I8NG52_MUSDO|nr:dolichyl-diphosphooligosaccharide--protein glycosyltransferase subunit 2 isoform X1 [Musca domestica]
MISKSLLFLAVAFVLCVIPTSWAARTVDSHLSSSDLQRFQNVFSAAFSSNDLQSIYYATLNIEPTKSEEKKELCQKLNKFYQESKLNEFEKDFYLVGITKNLKCTEKLPEQQLSKIYAAFKSPVSSAQEVFYRVATHKYLGVEIDETTKAKIVKNLQDILKKDDTLTNLGYAFNVATELGPSASFIADRIEDAIVQADEVDGKLLQFEGGLSITSLIINGAFKASKTFGKSLPIDATQAVKFANYFLSRRSVQTAKGAHVLIEALKTLSSASSKVSPICIQLIGNGQLVAESPVLTVAVVDLLGKPLSPAPQNVVGKVFAKKDNSVLADKIAFTSKSSDKTTYVANLATYKPSRALYVAEISADSTYTQKFNFKVLGKVKVQQLEIGVGELDASSAIKKQPVSYPQKLKEQLSGDHTQKVLLKTTLVEESQATKPITVHQAFVRFYNEKEDKEIIYIAEQDSSKAYKFDMDIGARAGDFNYVSGVYQIYLIVGDASISNSFQWLVADIELKFPAASKTEERKQVVRAPLPEIEHQFRVPDKRPSRIVSDVFTGLCLTPLVLLLVFWSKLGINIGNFNWQPSAIGFHLGFGGILVLFAVFWFKLNMFQTLRCLIPIAIFTFLCGNRLLRRLYAQRMAKIPASSSSVSASS